jgi:hypothetical protein
MGVRRSQDMARTVGPGEYSPEKADNLTKSKAKAVRFDGPNKKLNVQASESNLFSRRKSESFSASKKKSMVHTRGPSATLTQDSRRPEHPYTVSEATIPVVSHHRGSEVTVFEAQDVQKRMNSYSLYQEVLSRHSYGGVKPKSAYSPTKTSKQLGARH